MSGDDELREAAVQQWRVSPVTALVVRWLMPAVGDLLDELVRRGEEW